MNVLQAKKCSSLENWLETTRQLSPTKAGLVWGAFIDQQDKINQELAEFIPKAIHEMSDYAMDFLEMLPEDRRYEITFALLKKNEPCHAPALIQKLKAMPGVIQAVQNYLIETAFFDDAPKYAVGKAPVDAGKIRFNDVQVKQMFEGRFSTFFPLSKYNLRPTYEHLHFALLTLRNQSIENNVCQNHRLNTAEVNILGYYFPTAMLALNNRLREGFGIYQLHVEPERLEGRKKELLSLIALGFYHKQGHTTFANRLGRGMTQVEKDIPELHALINSILKDSSVMAQMPRLYRRLLCECWGYHNTSMSEDTSHMSNIEFIRFLAETLGEALPDFKSLRVEIHNLPTLPLLKQVREYKEKFTGPEAIRTDLNRLIASMEKFLNIGNSLKVVGNTWEELVNLRETNRQAPETIANSLADSSFRDAVLRLGVEELDKIAQQKETSEVFQASLNLADKLIDQVLLDDMLSVDTASRYKNEMSRLAQDQSLSLNRRMELVCVLLENLIDQVQTPLQENLGKLDEILSHLSAKEKKPLKFVDSLLRSHSIFLVGKLIDHLSSVLLLEKKLSHKIENKEFQAPVKVLNPGVAQGILRINKDPMKMESDEIGVFSITPFETAPVKGIITLGATASLSHLQLLVKGLNIPSVKVSAQYMEDLEKLEGKKIEFKATKEGGIELKACEDTELLNPVSSVEVPAPDHSIESPIAFTAIEPKIGLIAGPKGMNLARMFNSKELGEHVPDGFIIPFGFFRKFAKKIGIEPHLEKFAQLKLKNRLLVLDLAKQIQAHIVANPIPSEMLEEVETSLKDLKQRVNNQEGFFFRSDTNIEDLPGFNGAGLNETVGNVSPNSTEIDTALRKVWMSPFTEKSIFWRAKAISSHTALLAEPSVVVMPTVKAESSGVLISRGGDKWELKKGMVSADFGIGSVVEASHAVEETTFESKTPHRIAFSVASKKQVADDSAGKLVSKPITPGQPVLQDSQLNQLRKISKTIEQVMGKESHGWDIEWAFAEDKQLKILQARPNM